MIVPMRRKDESGDTFIFTQFLGFSTQSWEDEIGYGTDIAWPVVAGAKSGDRERGHGRDADHDALFQLAMPASVFATPSPRPGWGPRGSRTRTAGSCYQQRDGERGRVGADRRTPADERLSLVFAPGDDSYPLINYEYALVATKQPDAATAAALRRLLLWAVIRRRWERAGISRRCGLHCAARLHPRAEREADQPDQVVPGADGIVSLVIPLDGC